MTIRKPTSINNIRTAINKLTARAELAHKEGRDADGAEIERRIQAYREELGRSPYTPGRRKPMRRNSMGPTAGAGDAHPPPAIGHRSQAGESVAGLGCQGSGGAIVRHPQHADAQRLDVL